MGLASAGMAMAVRTQARGQFGIRGAGCRREKAGQPRHGILWVETFLAEFSGPRRVLV